MVRLDTGMENQQEITIKIFTLEILILFLQIVPGDPRAAEDSTKEEDVVPKAVCLCVFTILAPMAVPLVILKNTKYREFFSLYFLF